MLGPASPHGTASVSGGTSKSLLRSLGGSEANFLEVCFGRLPPGNFHTKATSKKSRPPSGHFRPNPPELPRSSPRSFSSHEAGWKIVLLVCFGLDWPEAVHNVARTRATLKSPKSPFSPFCPQSSPNCSQKQI